jgi:hypothetical protein
MKTLKVSPLVLIPMAVIMGAASLLSLIYGLRGRNFQMEITLILAVPLLCIFLSWLRRRVEWDQQHLKYRGILGFKKIPWRDIVEVRAFRAGFRKALYVGSGDAVLIIPLIFSYQEELGEAFHEYTTLEGLPSPSSIKLSPVDTALLWVGAALLIIILGIRLFG